MLKKILRTFFPSVMANSPPPAPKLQPQINTDLECVIQQTILNLIDKIKKATDGHDRSLIAHYLERSSLVAAHATQKRKREQESEDDADLLDLKIEDMERRLDEHEGGIEENTLNTVFLAELVQNLYDHSNDATLSVNDDSRLRALAKMKLIPKE
jgi:hypothetical protein